MALQAYTPEILEKATGAEANKYSVLISKPDIASDSDKSTELVDMFTKNDETKGLLGYEPQTFHFTQEQAAEFYKEHHDKDFFADLTKHMSSGPCKFMVVQGEDAAAKLRKAQGATNPAEAPKGSFREALGTSTTANAVHCPENAKAATIDLKFLHELMKAKETEAA